MKQKKSFLWLLYFAVFAAGIFAPKFLSSAKEIRVVGYLPNYRSSSVYEALDFSKLTHLNIAFCNPDENGNLSHGFKSDEIMHGIVKKAHENNVKVLASIGGDEGYTYLSDLTSANTYQSYNNKIMEFIEKFNLDGVDIDIERKAPSSFWENYERWAKDLRTKCTAKKKLMTTAVATSFSNKISDTTLSLFDFINVMAYDDDSKEGHSTYELAYRMLKHYEEKRNISPGKLVLGVPFYGRSSNDANSFQGIIAMYPDAWNVDTAGGYSYNGIQTIKWKASLAKGYGGVMAWELTQDAKGEHSLLQAIYDTLTTSEEDTITSNTTKVISSGETLTNRSVLIVDGTLKNNGRIYNEGLIIVNGTIINNGQITNNSKLINNGSIKNGIINGQENITGTLGEINNITVTPYTGTYDNQYHKAVSVQGTLRTDIVYYKVNNGSYQTTVPKVKEVSDSCKVTVKVVRNENFSPWESKNLTVTVKKATVSKTTSFQVKTKSSSQISLNWNKVSQAAGYEVYRSTKKNSGYKRVKVLEGSNKNTFTDTHLISGTTYYYKIRAYKTLNKKKIYSSYSKVKYGTTNLTKVQFYKINKNEIVNGSVKLRFQKTKRAQGYMIYRSAGKNGKYTRIAVIKGGNRSYYLDKKADKGKRYYYKIRAYATITGKKVYGSYSEVRSVLLK